MTDRAIILRETAISMAINAVLSVLFFLAVFGLSVPVTIAHLAPDFLPQALMIGLMGSLVPGLLTARGSAVGKGPIVRRASGLAIASLVVAGGGAYAVCMLVTPRPVDPVAALIGKAVFGAALAAIITPIAVRAVLRARQGSPA